MIFDETNNVDITYLELRFQYACRKLAMVVPVMWKMRKNVLRLQRLAFYFYLLISGKIQLGVI